MWYDTTNNDGSDKMEIRVCWNMTLQYSYDQDNSCYCLVLFNCLLLDHKNVCYSRKLIDRPSVETIARIYEEYNWGLLQSDATYESSLQQRDTLNWDAGSLHPSVSYIVPICHTYLFLQILSCISILTFKREAVSSEAVAPLTIIIILTITITHYYLSWCT